MSKLRKSSRRSASEYSTWSGMIQRCNNPNNAKYKYYGGRGISVCERWRNYDDFLADMGERPKGYELERIENSANYTPENCKWATKKEQANNSRRNHKIKYAGISLNLQTWGEFLNIKPNTILTRIRRGWPVQRALGFE